MAKKKEKITKQDIAARVEIIIIYARNAHNALLEYQTDSSKRNIKGYFNVRYLVDGFYKNNSAKIQDSKNEIFDTYMLQAFATFYPKQYKLIIKRLSKEGITIEPLLNFKNPYYEAIDQFQKERRIYASKLVSDMGELRGYSRSIVGETYKQLLSKIDEITNDERETIGAGFKEVNVYKIATECFDNVCQVQGFVQANEKVKTNQTAKLDNKERVQE